MSNKEYENDKVTDKRRSNMKSKIIFSVVVIFAMVYSTIAEGWSFKAGPAWRDRAKTSFSGSVDTPTISGASATKVEYGKHEVVQDPDYPDNPSFQKYADTKIITESVVSKNSSEVLLRGGDTDSVMGFKADLGYELWKNDRWSFGLNLKLAGYWNMESQVSGVGGGGTIHTTVTKDYYLYSSGPIPNDADFTGFYADTDPYLPYHEETIGGVKNIPGTQVSVSFCSDLWQIGFGPTLEYKICNGLKAYTAVEALCNIVAMDFDGYLGSDSEVDCVAGFGARLGLEGQLSSRWSVFAEAGYEWIDEAKASSNGRQVKVDYSSSVLSAGVIFNF